MLSHTARAAEWEKITGACDTSRARRATASETWDKSTIMPRRFISATTFCRDGLGRGCQGCICLRCVYLEGPGGAVHSHGAGYGARVLTSPKLVSPLTSL